MDIVGFGCIALIGIILVILMNFWLVRSVIKRAIRKFVKPELHQQGLKYNGYKWVGFFGTGDFKKSTELTVLTSGNGKSSLSVYVYIYYDDAGVEKRFTVRIDTVAFFIRKVVHSANFTTIKEKLPS